MRTGIDVPPCYVEAFRCDRTGLWGWQCFVCPTDEDGYDTIDAAEDAADEHARTASRGRS